MTHNHDSDHSANLHHDHTSDDLAPPPPPPPGA